MVPGAPSGIALCRHQVWPNGRRWWCSVVTPFTSVFLIALLFFMPHILLVEDAFGLSWPALPYFLVDAATVVALLALLLLLGHRISHPVRRFLSTFQDYLVWLLTFLPLLTGYFTYHRMLLPYTDMLAYHILSVELLLIAFPFTNLMHTFTLFSARWYNGATAGRRGVSL